MFRHAFGSAVGVCVLASGAPAGDEPHVGLGLGVGHYSYPHTHYPHGPRVAPAWGYPGLAGGPYVGYPLPGAPGYPPLAYRGFGYPGFGYPYYPGFFGYSGRAGSSWSNGLSLYGPPVPTYAPLPGVFGGNDLNRQWRATLAPGFAGYGFVGIYNISPRPVPRTVSVWPRVEGIATAPISAVPAVPAAPGGCLILSVRVPQPAAEVLVDGQKTTQTGTDRTFESPPLDAGKGYSYTVTARWVERGQTVEVSKVVSGTPGEVVRVDFGAPGTAGR